MPDMDGLELSKKLSPLYPGLKSLFMSGYPRNVIDTHGELDEGINFIQKPFSMQNLAQKIRKTLEKN